MRRSEDTSRSGRGLAAPCTPALSLAIPDVATALTILQGFPVLTISGWPTPTPERKKCGGARSARSATLFSLTVFGGWGATSPELESPAQFLHRRLVPPRSEHAPYCHEVRLLHLTERLLVERLVVIRHASPLAQERQQCLKEELHILIKLLPFRGASPVFGRVGARLYLLESILAQ